MKDFKKKKRFSFYRETKEKIRLEDQERKCKRQKSWLAQEVGEARRKKKKKERFGGKVRRRVV